MVLRGELLYISEKEVRLSSEERVVCSRQTCGSDEAF